MRSRMKRYIHVSLLISVIAIILLFPTGCQQASCQKENPKPPPPEIIKDGNTRVYKNYEYGFSFTICNDQEFEVVENMGRIPIALLGPTLGDFKTRIGVFMIANKAPKNFKLEDYAKESKNNAAKTLANFAIEKETTLTIGGIEAQQTLYTYTTTLGDHNYTFRNALILFLKGDNSYAIKYETPDEFYDQYSDCFDLLLATFKFF
jgi:hypothetical protein